AKIILRPGYKPEIESSGEIFGGKLSAQGEVYQDNTNNIKPELIINLANLDLAALSAALPELNAFKPSGRVNLNTRVHSDLNIDGSLSSAKVAAKISGNNLALNNLSANFNYDVNNNKALIKAFKANFNNALLSAAGAVDIKNNNLDLKASARNFNPASLPQVKNQLKGLFNADAVIKGALDNPSVNAKVSGKNVIADNNIKLGDLNLALNYFDNKLNVAQSQVRMPGGALNFKGNVNLNNNLINFDLSSGQNGINLAQVSQNLKLAQPVTGNIKGAASVTGSLKNLGAKLILNAENIKTQGVNIPYAVIEAGGNAGQIKVKKLDAKINEARITGRGGVKINYNNFLESALNIILSVNGLEVRPLLTRLMGSSPLGGILYGDLAFTGTPKDPTLSVKVNSPLTVNQTLIDVMSLKLKSPSKDKYNVNAQAKMADFKLDLNGTLSKNGDVYLFDVKSQPIDIDKLIAAKVPSLKGLTSGNAFIDINGSSKLNFPVSILAKVPSLKVLDGKINIKNISVPIKFMMNLNKIAIKNARAELASGGVITSNIDVDLAKSLWTGTVGVNKLDFGKLAAPFLKEYLKEGELVGVADASVGLKGNLGVFALSFASGKFSTGPGYFHKMKILERITPAKRISFENIRGTFSWDGSDLFLNPGTQATAPTGEPLYRYFAVNGACGLPGKNLRLLCDGRFDLKILDRILGAMKGAFQYVTGSLTGGTGFLKDAAGRMLGVKRRDFQNVTFTLANSWNELRLLDLKITKPIQDFLPLDKLNGEEEQKKETKQFKLNLKIPVGQGNLNPEDNTTQDQLKEQLVDNLFNF
ncbi:MAG: hypothetical protein IJ576_04390, partial [Synergistaceae bacterium]|nr:hypothetical protein [Synergistaceae bacterium]